MKRVYVGVWFSMDPVLAVCIQPQSLYLSPSLSLARSLSLPLDLRWCFFFSLGLVVGWLSWLVGLGWLCWLVRSFDNTLAIDTHFPLPSLAFVHPFLRCIRCLQHAIQYHTIPYRTPTQQTTSSFLLYFAPFFDATLLALTAICFFLSFPFILDDCGRMDTLWVERCDVPALPCNKQKEPWLILSCISRSFYSFPGGTPVRRSVPWTPNHPTQQKHRREGDAQEWTHQPDEELAQGRHPNQQNTSSPAIIAIPCDGACYPGAASSP